MANIFNREFLEINLGGKKIPKSAIPENSEITIEYERDSMTETLRAADGTIVYHQTQNKSRHSLLFLLLLLKAITL